MEGRETRFTADVIAEAKKRLDALTADEDSTIVPQEVLGWSTFAGEEAALNYADDRVLIPATDRNRVASAFLDGMMMGAVAADVTYERVLGWVRECE